jgi:hypothetical protein
VSKPALRYSGTANAYACKPATASLDA